jgi:hypothetical protein
MVLWVPGRERPSWAELDVRVAVWMAALGRMLIEEDAAAAAAAAATAAAAAAAAACALSVARLGSAAASLPI